MCETELYQVLLKYKMRTCRNESSLLEATHLEIVTPQKSSPGFTRNLEHGYSTSLWLDRNQKHVR